MTAKVSTWTTSSLDSPERGEMATNTLDSDQRGQILNGAPGPEDPRFIFDPAATPGDIVNGVYQLEIRRGTDNGTPAAPQLQLDVPQPRLVLTSTFDTNDRLVESSEYFPEPGADLSHLQTFVLGDGDVDITFRFEDHSIDEANDTLDTAGAIDLSEGAPGHFRGIGIIGDGFVSGDNNNLEVGLDVDLIALNLDAGDIVEVDVDAHDPDTPQGIQSGLDSVLRLFDAAGTPLAVSDNDAAPGEVLGPGFRDPFIRYLVPASGTYFFGISGPGNIDYQPDSAGSGTQGIGVTGPYEIDISVNGARADAGTTIVVPFATFESASTVANRLVELINSDDVQSSGFDVVASRVGNTERIQFFGPNVRVDRVKKDFATEENGTLNSPVVTDVLPGQNRNYRAVGEIGDSSGPSPDVDLFRVELTAGDFLRVDLATSVIGSPLTAALQILDDAGDALLAFPPPGATGPSLVTRVPETGFYLVEVTGVPRFHGTLRTADHLG